MIAYHDYFIERQQKGAYRRRLVKQLERMGYDVVLLEDRVAQDQLTAYLTERLGRMKGSRVLIATRIP